MSPSRTWYRSTPGSERGGVAGNVVLRLAGPNAVSAADAFLDVDGHRPPVVGDSIRGQIGNGPLEEFREDFSRRGRHEEILAREEKEPAAVGRHDCSSCSGWWGLWQLVHAAPSECSFGFTWGNFEGLPTLARWQVTQVTRIEFAGWISGFSACPARAPWHASQENDAWRLPFCASATSE